MVKYSKTAKSIQLATVLVPFGTESVDCKAESQGKDLFQITYGDHVYQIILTDGLGRIWENFEFDGEMLCAKFNSKGILKECSGVNTSRIIFKGESLLDATIRKRENVTVTID